MSERAIETRRGIKLQVREAGRGAPLVFLHGAGGLVPEEPLLDALAERFHVFAPLWPGFGAEPGEELLEDMLDFTLHGFDVVEALGLERPHLVGHSMGGMIAAEMACAEQRGHRAARAARAGRPLARRAPDPGPVRDAAVRAAAATCSRTRRPARSCSLAGLDFIDNEALTRFMVGQRAPARQRRARSSFPMPEPPPQQARLPRSAPRRCSSGAAQDRLIPPVYADALAGADPGRGLACDRRRRPHAHPRAAGRRGGGDRGVPGVTKGTVLFRYLPSWRGEPCA